MDKNPLAHTTWRCQYHIQLHQVAETDNLRKIYKVEIGKILKIICERQVCQHSQDICHGKTNSPSVCVAPNRRGWITPTV